VGVAPVQTMINWLMIRARDDDGAANAVESGLKYVTDEPLIFSVPVVKQLVPAPPVWASNKVTEMLRFRVVGTLVILMVVIAALTPDI